MLTARARVAYAGAREFLAECNRASPPDDVWGDDTQSEADKNRKVSVQILVGVRAYDNHFHHSYYMRVV